MPAHAANMPTAHPLDWPPEYQRTDPVERQSWPGNGGTFADARDALLHELERSGCEAPVLSSNIETYRRGGNDIPYANQPQLEDPGVAVYFTLAGELHCYACDAYETVPGNIKSLSLDLRDLRRIEKRGSLRFMERAFQGFRALPAEAASGAGGACAWWEVLDISRDAAEQTIKEAFRNRALEAHPDRGGSKEKMHRLLEARRKGLDAKAHAN